MIVDSDHKALETIFGKPLAAAPRRLQKMFMRLQLYDIDIQYKKGSEMYLADTLSSHFIKGQPTKSTFEEEFDQVPLTAEINRIIATEEKISKLKVETEKDEVLQQVKGVTQAGWPENKNMLNPTLVNYFHVRDELTVQEGVVLCGEMVVIPKSLRKEILEDLHTAHQGVKTALRRARESIYWPNMNSEIKEYISRCETCTTFSTRQLKEPLSSHEVPNRPWAKIGTNLFQFQNKDYLVTVDYFSNFFEIDYLSTMTSNTATTKLKGHFVRYGIPEEVVSDNGPQYDSDEFQGFAKSFGFKHTRTSPHYPQSNGKAELAVKQAKKILQMTRESGTNYYLALLNIRNMPQEGHNSSPAQRMINRRTRTSLHTSKNLLKPRLTGNDSANIAKKQAKKQHYYNRGAKTLEKLWEGDRVKIQPFGLREKKWSDGKVIRESQPRSYEVEANGRVYIRNRKHLCKCTPAQESEVEEDAYLPMPDYGREGNNEQEGIQQERVETQPAAKRKLPAELEGDQEYQTRSRRMSKRPVRFGELTDQ